MTRAPTLVLTDSPSAADVDVIGDGLVEAKAAALKAAAPVAAKVAVE